MTTSDLGLASATDLVKLYKARKASPVETTKAALARIAKHNPALNAFVLVDDGAALAAARASEKRWAKKAPLGKVLADTERGLVIAFWATWCKPCQKEIPAFSRVYDKYKPRGVVFLGVLTGDQATADELLNFASDNEMTYPIVRENSDIRMSFIDDMDNLPTTLIFDRAGKQIYGRAGGLSEQRLSELLEPLVAQK